MKHAKILMALALPMLLTGCVETAKGDKNGFITKVAKQGFFCPTWEAQIIRGGFNNGSGASGAAFDFTIEDEALAQKVAKLSDERKEVKLTYRKEAVSFCRSDSHNYFLVSIEEIKPTASNVVGQVASNGQGPDLAKIVRLQQVQAELLNELAKGVK